jgi:hypothetical protein
MQKIIKLSLATLTTITLIVLLAFTSKNKKTTTLTHSFEKQKIQVAILLDVSNSMDGLIEQAKAQLWNMVSVMGKAKCNDASPDIEIALYEYGRTNNDAKAGYVKQINSFINNLDSLSENLFKLTTNGGEEYCGEVIYQSIDDLKWDANKNSYKVIFIAGNEDFLQGKKQYTEGCAKAKKNGIIVNTIYCGDKMQGIREHWNLGAECGEGSYTAINSNAKMEEIPTPYDSTFYVLNDKLNNTYLSYGYRGLDNKNKQAKMDQENATMSKSAGIKRASAKAQKSVYKNDDWDLVDGLEKDAKLLDKVEIKTLPDSLKNKTKDEIAIIVKQKATERTTIQNEMKELNLKREAYLVDEKKRRATKTNEPTLETEVEKIIKSQASRFNMKIE